MDYHRLYSDGKDREKKRNGKEKGGENEGKRKNLTVQTAKSTENCLSLHGKKRYFV